MESKIHISPVRLGPGMMPVRVDEDLSTEDSEHSDEVEQVLNTNVNELIANFIDNDDAVRALHPGSRPPEKGFLERHKVLGVFLIGAAALMTIATALGTLALYVGAIMAAVALTKGAALLLLIYLWVYVGGFIEIAAGGALTFAMGYITYELTMRTFRESIQSGDATLVLRQKLQRAGVESPEAISRSARETFKQMKSVKTTRGGAFRSVAEVDFLVKYSNLPDPLKRELLSRFYNLRNEASETPATLLRREEREFESTMKLESIEFRNALAVRLGINQDEMVRGELETWGQYYQRLYSHVIQNPLFQSLPEERKTEIQNLLDTYPATKLFHALQDLVAVETVVTRDASKILGDATLKAIQNAPLAGGQVALETETITNWLTGQVGRKAIADELATLSRNWTYQPIIPYTPVYEVMR